MSTIQTTTPPPKVVQCPFTVLIDTREQKPFTFEGLWGGPADGPKSKLIKVPTERATLKTGDYGIKDYPLITVERKSIADLYSSVSQGRENFIGRLERMCLEYHAAFVVVEGELSQILQPQPHTNYAPKSLNRTILSWMIRYSGVQWIFAPSPTHAAHYTFRLFERYWKDRREREKTGWSPAVVRQWDAQLVKEIDQENAG